MPGGHPHLQPDNRTGNNRTVENTVILVVEDEAIIRMSAVQMLEDAGFLVLEAGDADAAVALLESRGDICAVFTDIEMPGSCSGLKLAKAIRDRWPPIHLIVTSGRVSPAAPDLPCLARFIGKPYTPNQILAALGDLLGFLPIPIAIRQRGTCSDWVPG
jgi:CheY-like chemotaxis protein